MNIVAFRSNKGGEVTHSRESGNLAVPSNHSLHFQLQSRGRKNSYCEDLFRKSNSVLNSILVFLFNRFQVSLDTTLKDEDCVCINCGCTAPLC